MNSARRFVNKGQKPSDVFANRVSRYSYVNIGRVLVVNLDTYTMHIEWIHGGHGVPRVIPISFAFCGPSGCIGGIPEEGSIGVFAFYQEGGSILGSPVPIAWLPSGLAEGMEFNSTKSDPDCIPKEEVGFSSRITYQRFRKLNKNELIMAAPMGASILLNKSISIEDGAQEELLIRDTDGLIATASISNHMFSDGVFIAAGPIQRNSLEILDQYGNRKSGILGQVISGQDKKNRIYLVPNGMPIDEATQFYSEYRIDVEDLVDQVVPTNDIMGHVPSDRIPLVTMMMGNYSPSRVGDSRYGKIVRPVLFRSPQDQGGEFELVDCVQNKGLDEVSVLGIAWGVHLLSNESFIGLDKEGHLYMNLGASVKNPLGSGRSISILTAGSKKEVIGSDSASSNSWDLTTNGGIQWDIGASNRGVSLDIATSKSVRIEVRGADEEGFGKKEFVGGNSKKNISGTEISEIGSSTTVINGLRVERIEGTAVGDYQNDKTDTVLGVCTMTVLKEMQEKFGSRSTTIGPVGNSSLTVLAGDISETIVSFGNKKTIITGPGNILEVLSAGNRLTNIGTGAYNVTVGAGSVSISVGAGTVSITGTSVNINGIPAVNVNGLSVNLGPAGIPKNGVVTGIGASLPSHFDYVTGLPLRGSFTVKASI